MNEDDLNKAEEIIRKSKVLVCQLEIRSETVAAALKLARKHSGKTRDRLSIRMFCFRFSSFDSQSGAHVREIRSRTFETRRSDLSKSN